MILVTIDVVKTISDEETLELFRNVATTATTTTNSTINPFIADILISKTKLIRKQFYSRMSSLMKPGLIKRNQGKHILNLTSSTLSSRHMLCPKK
jgi:hypothetical protein